MADEAFDFNALLGDGTLLIKIAKPMENIPPADYPQQITDPKPEGTVAVFPCFPCANSKVPLECKWGKDRKCTNCTGSTGSKLCCNIDGIVPTRIRLKKGKEVRPKRRRFNEMGYLERLKIWQAACKWPPPTAMTLDAKALDKEFPTANRSQAFVEALNDALRKERHEKVMNKMYKFNFDGPVPSEIEAVKIAKKAGERIRKAKDTLYTARHTIKRLGKAYGWKRSSNERVKALLKPLAGYKPPKWLIKGTKFSEAREVERAALSDREEHDAAFVAPAELQRLQKAAKDQAASDSSDDSSDSDSSDDDGEA